MAQFVNTFEELWELREQVDYLTDDYHAELHSLAFASESFHYKLESYFLQGAVDDPVLDYCTVELGYLLEILSWILVQEAVLVKQGMQHAGVDLLLFFNF